MDPDISVQTINLIKVINLENKHLVQDTYVGDSNKAKAIQVNQSNLVQNVSLDSINLGKLSLLRPLETKPSPLLKTKPSLHPLPRALGRRDHQTSCSLGRGEGR